MKTWELDEDGYPVFMVPKVVNRLNISRTRKQAMLSRQGDKCYYCGNHLSIRNLTVDHKTPSSRCHELGVEFPNDDSNLCCSCYSCNEKKADMTEAEYWIFIMKGNFDELHSRRTC